MAVKKKKNTTKKSAKPAKKIAKKATKKVAKAKKIVKKSVKNAKKAKKTVKKVAAKVAPKKSGPIKKVVKAVQKIPAKKPISSGLDSVAKPMPQKPRSSIQSSSSRPTMSEQSNKKMTGMHQELSDEMVVTESAERKKPTTLLGALEFTPYQSKSDEAYMNEHQREHFRKILNAWKQQLMQDVDLTVGHLKEEAVFYADPVDRASQEEGFNLELRTRDRERKLIKKIEQSLDLINTGEYGHCEDCGAEIGIRRLEARPTAVKCIDCKTFQEIREKQLGG